MATPTKESQGAYPGADLDSGGQYGGTAGKLDEGRHGDHFNDALDPAYNVPDWNKKYPSWEATNPTMKLSEGEEIGLKGVNEIAYDPMSLVSSEKIVIDPAPANRGKEN